MAGSLATTWRRMRYGPAVVVVSGLPRSGTSMAMKMLEAGGLELVTDGVRPADEDNPKGYYELERVKNLHRDRNRAWLRQARGKGIKVISYLLRSLPATNNYKVLFMNRDLGEVLASQRRMLDRRGEESETSDERMIDLYRRDLREVRFMLGRRRHFEVLEIDYTRVLTDARGESRGMAAFLGLPLDVEAMTGVVDRRLYRNRAEDLAGTAS